MQNDTIINKKYNGMLSLISGILLAISFTFKSFWWVSFFGLVPFYMVILGSDLSIKRFIKYIFLLSFGYYVPLMMWLLKISVILPMSKGFAIALLTFAIILIGLIQGVYIVLATFLFARIKTGKFRDVIFFSFLFILGEWLQENTPVVAFPWAKLGVIVTKFPVFIQSASIFGGLFISFLILFINGCIAYSIVNFKNSKKVIFTLSVLTAVFFINIFYGAIRINSEKEQKGFKAMVVQANFSGLNKWKTSNSDMFLKYIDLTKKGLANDVKLVIWPETAIPTNFYNKDIYKNELEKIAKEYDTTLIVGFYINNGGEKSYNSLIAISPDGTIAKPYYKQILAPFGEYFPLSNFFMKVLPIMSEIIENASTSARGEKSQIIDTELVQAGGIICYESIFSKIARNNIKDGAEILIVASNDSWFGESAALWQHHSHAIMRAVETNRFVLRASNTGISSIISPNGEVIISAKSFVATSATSNIYLKNKKTLYCFWGDIIVLPAFLIILYGVGKLKRKNK